jgi:hypothetical protein
MLAPGDYRDLTLRIAVGPITPGHALVRNCGRIDWTGLAGDINPGNDYDCAEVSRFPPGHPGATAMLDVQKKALPVCFPGAGPTGGWICAFDVLISNIGGAIMRTIGPWLPEHRTGRANLRAAAVTKTRRSPGHRGAAPP